MDKNYLVLSQVPVSISKIQLRLLVREVCHLNICLKSIEECHSGGNTKTMIIDFWDYTLPFLALRRLTRLGREVLPNVIVQFPHELSPSNALGLPEWIRQKYAIPPNDTKALYVATSAMQLVHYELHLKYPQLQAIDFNYSNAVYIALAVTMANRIIEVMKLNCWNHKVISKATELYRKLHPHSEDYELVAAHIKKVEKEQKLTFTNYSEAFLLVPTPPPEYNDKLKEQFEECSEIVNDKVLSYIENLDSEIQPEDSAEMIHRKKVRQAIKQFSAFLPQMVKYTPIKDLSETSDWINLYFLGEPSLPTSETIKAFLSEHGITYHGVQKVDWSSSSAKVQIDRSDYDKMMQFNGRNPGFGASESQTSTEKLYVRHTNGKYLKEKYMLAANSMLQKWASKWSKSPPKARASFQPQAVPFKPRFSGPVKSKPRAMRFAQNQLPW